MPMHAGRDPLRFVFQNTVSGHALLVRREVFEAARPFPDLLYHDWWLAMRAAAGNGVVYVDAPLVQFRRHASAFSPLGKKHEATTRAGTSSSAGRKSGAAARNRKWLEERLYLAGALAATGWRGTRRSARMATMHSRRRWTAIRRRCGHWLGATALAAAVANPAWLNAFRFCKRCLRKLRRAAPEPNWRPRLIPRLFRT